MYISSLTIQNYRNFRNFTIRLKPLTLIIGENNIGKSNLLDSIGLILSQDVSIYKRRMLEIADFNSQSILDLKRQILDTNIPAEQINFPEIKVTLTLTDWTEDQEAVIADWYSRDGQLNEATLTYQFSPILSFNKVEEIAQQREFIAAFRQQKGEEVYERIAERDKLSLVNFPISKYNYTIYGGVQRDSQVNSYHLGQLKFELLDALRDAKTELVASHSSKLLFRILSAKEENEYQDIKAELIGLQEVIDRNGALRAIKASISEQLNKISLRTERDPNTVDFLFSLPNVEDLLKKISLIYGLDPVLIERNGTGRNNLLFISLILSFIEDTSRGRSAYFRAVGLEEPEAHLHPNLQDHLASNIEELIKLPQGTETAGGRGAMSGNRKDIQVLLTSHSTHISTKIDFENTVILYNNAGTIAAHYIFEGFSGNAQARKNLKYLNKYLDAVNTNFFYSRKVVLVEGISEKLLVPVFFKMHSNHSPESLGCCVLNVNGLAFSHFLEVIRNGYFVKCLVLTDSDTGTATENRAANLSARFSGVPVIRISSTVEPTFEKDIIAANRSGAGKEILLRALVQTRSIVGPQYRTRVGDADLNIEEFFQEIEEYKSDFAYALMMELSSSSTGFIIPPYISVGLDYLLQ